MNPVNDKFIQLMDDMIIQMKADDTELANALKYIDQQAARTGVGFYQVAYNMIQKKNAENNAAKWLKSRK